MNYFEVGIYKHIHNLHHIGMSVCILNEVLRSLHILPTIKHILERKSKKKKKNELKKLSVIYMHIKLLIYKTILTLGHQLIIRSIKQISK